METNLQTASASDKTTTKMLFAAAGLFFLYTAARACLLSITWDEAYSYIEFVRRGVFYPRQYNTMSANNHLLYTWLEIRLVNVFGVSELVLRLPSLFAHILFLLYSGKLVSHFNNKGLAVASFLIINLNPYLLDFFSLARGYGLSLGLMMGSIYYLYVFTKDLKNRSAVCAVVFAALGVLANYVLLNYLLALFGTLALLMAYNSGSTGSRKLFGFLKGMLIPAIIFSAVLWIVVPVAFKLKEAGALFFGGNRGFWSDTFSTVTDRSFYELGYSYWFQRAAKGFAIVVIVGAGIFFITALIRKKGNEKKLFSGVLLFLLGISAMSTLIQHYFLGTLYLMDRTALFLVVLFNLVFVFFINELSKERTKASLVAYAAGGIMLIHFFSAFNLTYVLEWRSDANTKNMLADLGKIKTVPLHKNNISVGIPLEFDPGINFYRDIYNLNWLNTACRVETTSMLHDYFYFSPEELASANKDSIEILKTYPLTGNVLAKPRYAYSDTKICLDQSLNFGQEPAKAYAINPEMEYSQGFSYVIDDSITPLRNALVTFQVRVMAPSVQSSDLWMVISMENPEGCYSWQGAYIRDYVKKKDEWTTVDFSCIIPSKAKAGDVLKAYIWNQNKQELSVEKMRLKWIEYNY